ncbi:MAG: hypothetical protein HY308_17745 [Gammaproteobacteria bacterium]|nr:hypothetical protein [Gammaproteobacteria bacterium]
MKSANPVFSKSNTTLAMVLLLCATGLSASFAYAGGDQSALPARLPDAKISLVDGINRAEQLAGLPISAKLEMSGKDLHLSVYTAKQGRAVAAEQNELVELDGDATKTSWSPEKEVFGDKPHIARSAMHLTVMQQTQLSLAELVKKAAAQQQGMIYSITPAIQNGKPAFKLLALQAGKTVESWIDLAGNPLAY